MSLNVMRNDFGLNWYGMLNRSLLSSTDSTPCNNRLAGNIFYIDFGATIICDFKPILIHFLFSTDSPNEEEYSQWN